MTNENDKKKNKNKKFDLLRQQQRSPMGKEGTPVQAGRQRRSTSRRNPKMMMTMEEKPRKHRSLSPRKVLKALLGGTTTTKGQGDDNEKDLPTVQQKQPSSPSSSSPVSFQYPKPIVFRKGVEEEPSTPPMKKQSQVVVSTTSRPERRKSASTESISSPIKGVDDTSSPRQVQQFDRHITSQKNKSPRQKSPGKTKTTTTSPPFKTSPSDSNTKKKPLLNVLKTVDELPLVKPTTRRSKYRASLESSSSPRKVQDNGKKKGLKQRRPSKQQQEQQLSPLKKVPSDKLVFPSSPSFQYPKPFSFRDLEDNNKNNGDDEDDNDDDHGDLGSLTTTTTIDQLPIPMKSLSCSATAAADVVVGDATSGTTIPSTATKSSNHRRRKKSVKTRKNSRERQIAM